MTDQTDDARKAEEMWTALRGNLEAEAAAVDVEKEAWRHLVAQAGGAAEHLVAQASPNAAGQRDYYNIVVWAEDRVPDDTGWILVDEAFGDCVTPDGHVDHQALDNSSPPSATAGSANGTTPRNTRSANGTTRREARSTPTSNPAPESAAKRRTALPW